MWNYYCFVAFCFNFINSSLLFLSKKLRLNIPFRGLGQLCSFYKLRLNIPFRGLGCLCSFYKLRLNIPFRGLGRLCSFYILRLNTPFNDLLHFVLTAPSPWRGWEITTVLLHFALILLIHLFSSLHFLKNCVLTSPSGAWGVYVAFTYCVLHPL